MARSLVRRYAIATNAASGLAQVVTSPVVTVYEPGTTTPIAQTLYADSTTSTTKTNPFTGTTDGLIEFWLDLPQDVNLSISGAPAGFGVASLALERAQISSSDIATKAGAEVLSNKALTAPIAHLLRMVVEPVATPPGAPGAEEGIIYPGDDGNLYYRIELGAAIKVGNSTLSDLIAGFAAKSLMLTTGTTPSLAALGLGTAHQELRVRSDLAGIEWGSGATKILDTVGSLLLGTGTAGTLAKLAMGTARQIVSVRSDLLGLEYVDSVQKVLTTTGDLVYASAANVLARLGIGANKTMLTSNGSVPAWSASPTVSGTLTAETSLKTNGAVLPGGSTSAGLRVPMASAAVAVDASVTIGTTTTRGFLKIWTTLGAGAIVYLPGGGAQPKSVYADPGTGWSIGADTAPGTNKVIVWWDGDSYEVVNRSVLSLTISASLESDA